MRQTGTIFCRIATAVVALAGWSLGATCGFSANLNDPWRFVSPSIDAHISPRAPGLDALDIDGLGRGKRASNAIRPPAKSETGFVATLVPADAARRAEYRRGGGPPDSLPLWSIEITDCRITLISRWSKSGAPAPLTLTFDVRNCHSTLLGIVNDDGTVRLPALMHLPGRGSLRISAIGSGDAALGYTARRWGDVTVIFPAATPATPRIEYQLEVMAIYPDLPGITGDRRFDSFRRNWLNVLQLNPALRRLANNSGSTSCAFCYYEYADIAAHTPPLADGLTALDVVRQTLDTILAGGKAYGLPAPGNFPAESSDTLPSLLISAGDCTQDGNHDRWLADNYAGIKGWADKMLATDTNGDGLVKYIVSGNSGIWSDGNPKVRPANWWDTIGFGYEDAYGNALAYRALGAMERMARCMGKTGDAGHYRAASEKLRDAYFKTFYNPRTGVLAGWRSADGELHDYYFLYVNGIAIHYGLVPPDRANGIMDALMAKMKEVGYTQFHLGLPGNLFPVALKDYVHRDPDGRHGGGLREDNADGFQKYENGGATGCFAYFTLAALYNLGRSVEADTVLFPMLEEYDRSGFEGWGANGHTNDWRMWDGTPMGYEGFLVDNYYALLAVFDREAALQQSLVHRNQ